MTASLRTPLRRIVAALALGALSALPGCGGGGVGTGGTGASGPITGFGSVIVAGTTFDDSAATVLDDDGTRITRDGRELRLGMTVQIDGETDAAGNGRAGTIRIASAIVGPAAALDTDVGRFSVHGQRVQVGPGTFFDAALPSGLAALRAGDRVAVFVLPEPVDGRYLATRIERVPDNAPPRLRGAVRQLDTAARTFRIGPTTLDYATATGVPADLANGRVVSVRLRNDASGPSAAVDAFGGADRAPRNDDQRHEIEGVVSAAASATTFTLDGVAVDASQAQIEPAGATVTAGTRVVLRGRITAGMLAAERVTVLGAPDIGARVYPLTGTVAALDASANTLVVRDTRVDFAGATFVNGSAASLALGVALRIEGTLSADGTQLRASRIELR